jgi:hypothetical protein
VNRDDIVRGAEELAMPLDEVIANVITALKNGCRATRTRGNNVEGSIAQVPGAMVVGIK